jgi:hypothetical protein
LKNFKKYFKFFMKLIFENFLAARRATRRKLQILLDRRGCHASRQEHRHLRLAECSWQRQ